MIEDKILNWSQLSKCPESPGVYAWYFRPELTDHDIEKLISDIKKDELNSKQVIEYFLNERIFKYFRQKQYHVEISGQLKPKYTGQIEHVQEPSSGLIERVQENPKRLFIIRALLEKSTPLFASPLYVGMSKNIKVRINQHCNFIKQLRDKSSNSFLRLQQYSILTEEEKSFAERVVEREIPPSRLFIAYQVVEPTEENVYVDLENIINRIYYPTFGRN